MALISCELFSESLMRATTISVILPQATEEQIGLIDQPLEGPPPVLYLLHGADSDDTSWTRFGDAERITARAPMIVVMPDGGAHGWYTDWYEGAAPVQPRWETYHVAELVPWIDATYRTIAARRGRAIAGLSMGGYGALSYAARHPGTFAAAASFSGALEAADVLSPLGAGARCFICGPTALVEVAANALVRLGLPADRVRTERFGPSGT